MPIMDSLSDARYYQSMDGLPAQTVHGAKMSELVPLI